MEVCKLPKIFLLDRNQGVTDCWKKCFKDEANVCIVCDDFESFIERLNENVAIVSPANGYGLMDGGYDAAIIGHYGYKLQKRVQEMIVEDFIGEQPVASGLVVDIDKEKNVKLFHIPTMKLPEPILDIRVIYHCMRVALIMALKDETIESIVIPAFGALTGDVPASIVAKQMYAAYLQIKSQLENPHMETWTSAVRLQMEILHKIENI